MSRVHSRMVGSFLAAVRHISCALLLFLSIAPAHYLQGGTNLGGPPALEGSPISWDVILHVQLQGHPGIANLRSEDILEGRLIRPVYYRNEKVVPAGSSIRLVVGKPEVQDHEVTRLRSFLLGVRTLLRIPPERRPHRVIPVRSAIVTLPDGSDVPLKASVIRMGVWKRVQLREYTPAGTVSNGTLFHNRDESTATGGKASSVKETITRQTTKDCPTVLVLHAEEASAPLPLTQARASYAVGEMGSVTLPLDARAHLMLLTDLHASKNRVGDVFWARLVEPIPLNDQLAVPEGSLFEGRITQRKPPRRLNRSVQSA
jgi:hypothetical protein